MTGTSLPRFTNFVNFMGEYGYWWIIFCDASYTSYLQCMRQYGRNKSFNCRHKIRRGSIMISDEQGQFQQSTRKVTTALSLDVEMNIRRTDWRRIYRKVNLIPRETTIYEVIENVAWGITAASLMALIPLYQSIDGAEAWVRPTFWVVAIASGVIALIARHYSNERHEVIKANCDEILQDMSEVYQTFFPGADLGDKE